VDFNGKIDRVRVNSVKAISRKLIACGIAHSLIARGGDMSPKRPLFTSIERAIRRKRLFEENPEVQTYVEEEEDAPDE
jgi:hypothetical protein